jgi:glycosyltransferase involved in cell wall biosynthesis
MKTLNLFYSEPDPDRWFKYDRYPRKIIRRIIRGKERPGGVMTAAINLMKGFDRLGISYRFNDYQYIKKHPEEIACIVGKDQLIFDRKWKNPILFGTGTYSHPIECPDLFEKYPHVKFMVVFGEWMRKMFEPYYGNKVSACPVGIDTAAWLPNNEPKTYDFLIYDKIRWNYNKELNELINPIKTILDKHGLTYQFITYGNYTHDELHAKIKASRSVIFLCEHETQGIAYQQILATNTPILAWDRGGYWQDPYYYPHQVKYQPVSSVPYWDERCGTKFTDAGDFEEKLISFTDKLPQLNPREYIVENLTLEKCAERYLAIYQQLEAELNIK